MCGIVGFVGARADMQEILQGMMDAIAHRGPDGQGQFIEARQPLASAAFPSLTWRAANSPCSMRTRTSPSSFNGEIYNFQELTAD